MKDVLQAFLTDRAGLWRLIRILVICLLVGAVIGDGLAPPTRVMALLALAAAFSMAALFELTARAADAPQTWLMLAVLLLFFGGAGMADYLLERADPSPGSWQGALLPVGAPTPPNACSDRKLATGDLLMIVGHDAVIGRGNGPFMPARIGTCPILTFTRVQGGLMVDGFGYDFDGNATYRIHDNDFHMTMQGFLQEQRPDRGTIRIMDISIPGGANRAQEAFSIRYLNRNAVIVRGIFRCQDSDAVTIDDGKVLISGKTVPAQPCLTAPAALAYGRGTK